MAMMPTKKEAGILSTTNKPLCKEIYIVNPHPLGKVKSVVPKKSHQKNPPLENEGVT